MPGGVLGLHDEGRRARLAATVVALLVAVVYLPTVLSADFVDLDDGQYVVENTVVRQPSLAGVRQVFAEVLAPSTIGGYYQPLTMLSLMADAWISGDPPAPFQFHLTNVVLHAVNCLLLMTVLRRLFGGVMLPATAALLFGLHPVQVESVAWISQRKTLLAAAAALAAVWCHIEQAGSRRPQWRIAAAGFYIAAMLAKPTVMGLPLLLVLLDIWPLRRVTWRTAVAEKFELYVIAAVGMWVAFESQSRTVGIGAPNWERLVDLITLCLFNLALYARNVVWPTALSLIYPIPTSLEWNSWAIGGTLAAVASGMLAWLSSWRWSRATFVAIAGAGALLGAAIGPVRFMQSCVGDRFLYLPLASLLLIPAAVATRQFGAARTHATANPRVRPSISILLGLLAAACLPLNWRRQAAWVDAAALWSDVLRSAPDHPLGLAGLAHAEFLTGREMQDAGRARDAAPLLGSALSLIDRAIAAEPANAEFHMNRAEVLTALKRGEEAVAAARRAVEIGLGSHEAQGQVVLGRALLQAGHFNEASAIFDALLAARPAPPFVLRMSMGYSMLEHARADAAVRYFSSALERSPREPTALQLLASSLATLGRWSDAAETYRNALAALRARGFDATESELGLAKVLLELGQPDEAEQSLDGSLAMDRYAAECRLVLAGVAAQRGRIDDAFRELADAVRLDPRLSVVAARKSYFSSLRGDPRWTLYIDHTLPVSAPIKRDAASSSPAGVVP